MHEYRFIIANCRKTSHYGKQFGERYMFDIILEIIRALIVLVIFIFLLHRDQYVEFGRRGWVFIKLGFLLILLGSLLDISDNFESLDSLIIVGDTPVQAFLEKVVGYLGGFAMLAYGLWKWLPSVQEIGHMEKAMRIAEGKRKLIYENSPIGIAFGRIDPLEAETNAEMARIYRYDSPEEMQEIIQQKGIAYFLEKDGDNQKILSLLKSKERISNYEAQVFCKDGSVAWVDTDISIIKSENGDNDYFYSFARDITQRKMAEQALAESEDRLRCIMEAMPTGIFLVDATDRKITDVNPAALKMTGYTREELIGTHCCDKLCPGRKDRCKAMEAGGTLINRETPFPRKDGSEFPALKTVLPISIQGRKFFLETFTDLTEQKQMERLKEDVDCIVQHDLRSPVSTIINAASISLMNDSVQGEVRTMLETIKDKGNKVLDMFGLSMTLHKIETGLFSYIPERLDLMGQVRLVISEVSEVTGKSVDFRVTLDGAKMDTGSSLPMGGNKLLMQSLLTNLLTNGVEASTEDSIVTLDIQSGPEVVLTFSNDGTVPKSIRENFFNKYVTSGKSAGTGLGTYSAGLIARTLGGSIKMDTSDAENRTNVVVRLPRSLP